MFYISDNRQTTDRKLPRTAFKPGQSGNPSGRPKENPEAKEILKAATVEAAKKLVGLLESKNEKMRFLAAQAILDRTQGKPESMNKIEFSDVSKQQFLIKWESKQEQEFIQIQAQKQPTQLI